MLTIQNEVNGINDDIINHLPFTAYLDISSNLQQLFRREVDLVLRDRFKYISPQLLFKVKFVAKGFHERWSLTIDGIPYFSNSDTITLILPSGVYVYTASDLRFNEVIGTIAVYSDLQVEIDFTSKYNSMLHHHVYSKIPHRYRENFATSGNLDSIISTTGIRNIYLESPFNSMW